MKSVSNSSSAAQPLTDIRMRKQPPIHNIKEPEETKAASNKSRRHGGTEDSQNIPVNCVSWNLCPKFSTQFMTADEQGYVTLWDAKRNCVLAKYLTNLSLSTGCIEHSQGQYLLCGGTSDSISLFEINRDAKRNEKTDKITLYKDYTGHSGNVTGCGFLSTEYFVTSSQDSQIGLWQVDETRALHMYNDHTVGVTTLDVFNMDGNVFATGSYDLTFRVWDIRMKNACFRKSIEGETVVSVVKFMPENMNTIAVGNNSEIGIYDLRALGKVCNLVDENENYETSTSLAFSKSGRLLFAQYPTDIKIWDLMTERTVGHVGERLTESDEELKSISMSENGQVLLATGINGQIVPWTI